MSCKETKVPGAPFSLAQFDITRHDVDKLFVVDASWQRDVREKSKVLPGIRHTLSTVGILRNPIHVFFDRSTAKHVVIDGKHRLAALASLDTARRCTLFAVVHQVSTAQEAEDLFVQFNLTVPPTLAHLLGIREREGHPTVTMLREALPFAIRTSGEQSQPGALNLNFVLRVLSMAFPESEIPKLDRHTMDSLLSAIDARHVSLLAKFSRIFSDASQGPITSDNPELRQGWFDVLFRIWVQNLRLRFTPIEWVERIKLMFGDSDVSNFRTRPRYAIMREAYVTFILRALSKRRAPRIEYDRMAKPTLQSLQE